MPGLDSPFQEEIFPTSNLNLPWHNLRTFPAPPSYQGVAKSHKGPPEPPFLQTQPFPSPVSPSWGSSPFPAPFPALDTLQPLQVSPAGPELDTALKVSHSAQHKGQSLSWGTIPAWVCGHTMAGTAQGQGPLASCLPGLLVFPVNQPKRCLWIKHSCVRWAQH